MSKAPKIIIRLLGAILCFEYIALGLFLKLNTTQISHTEHKPDINAELIGMSTDFLAACQFFKEHWDFAWNQLVDGESFNIMVPERGEPYVCGRFIPGGNRHFIFLYPAAWLESGCYEKSPMLVLSHEMLHQLGLPPHFSYDSFEAYLTNDPIEQCMRECTLEAQQNHRPTRWPGT